MSGSDWTLDDDHKTVTITFPTDPPVVLKLEVTGVEDLLRKLGDMRAHMQPEIPRKFAVGQTVSAVPDPMWVTEPELMAGNSVLHLRDPHFGWLHYMFPKAEAQKLALLLQNQAESPPPGLGSGKAN